MNLPMHSTASNTWGRNLAVCLFGSFTTVMSMTLLLPFLPLYVQQLGVKEQASILQWSGIAYAATFVTAGLVAPLWGRLGDRYGRKSMLLRASLGMAICVSVMGFASNIWQLVGLRLLVGLAGGYSSGATILVAVQTPSKRSGRALGLLATGVMAGNLVGPLLGGYLPILIGIRGTFWLAGALIFAAFIATALFVEEAPRPTKDKRSAAARSWGDIPHKSLVVAMMFAGLALMIANMSIEPIITVYVGSLIDDNAKMTMISGLVVSAAALGSVLSASQLGRLADRIGAGRVILLGLLVAALLLIPQAFVTSAWQLVALRFLMGLALGGLLPCIAAVIRSSVPERFVGTALGFSVSSQFAGQFVGPILGGFVGGHIGIRAVFFLTSGLLLLTACYVLRSGVTNRAACLQ